MQAVLIVLALAAAAVADNDDDQHTEHFSCTKETNKHDIYETHADQ